MDNDSLLYIERKGSGGVLLWGNSNNPHAMKSTPELVKTALKELKPCCEGLPETLASKTYWALEEAMGNEGLRLIAEIKCPDQPLGYTGHNDVVEYYHAFLLRLGCIEADGDAPFDFSFGDKHYRLPGNAA